MDVLKRKLRILKFLRIYYVKPLLFRAKNSENEVFGAPGPEKRVKGWFVGVDTGK